MGAWELLLTALGLMLVFEGISPFLAPGRFRDMLRQVAGLDDRTLRIAGFCAMLGGLLLLYLGKH